MVSGQTLRPAENMNSWGSKMYNVAIAVVGGADVDEALFSNLNKGKSWREFFVRTAPLEPRCAMPMCHSREAMKWKKMSSVNYINKANFAKFGSVKIGQVRQLGQHHHHSDWLSSGARHATDPPLTTGVRSAPGMAMAHRHHMQIIFQESALIHQAPGHYVYEPRYQCGFHMFSLPTIFFLFWMMVVMGPHLILHT